MQGLFAAPFAILFELDLPLHFFLVFSGVIIPPATHRALEPY